MMSLIDKLVFALCMMVTLASRDSDEEWGMKRARGSDEDWGMKRARGSDEDWGMKKRARGSDEDWGMKKKRSQCGRQGDSCYSTENCCKSFVCAVFDEHESETDMKPEVPGLCMHEKELTPCDSDLACSSHQRCSRLNANSPERYCVSRGTPRGQQTVKAQAKTGTGGLGATCADGGDCMAQTVSGEKLCCQKVTMGRQGTKQICDRVTSTSSCISK